MKVTSIRIKGLKPEDIELQIIQSQLEYRFAKAGFITEVSIVNKTSLKIGLWMKSFKLDTNKWDRNLQINPHLSPKLTTTPNWDQRVSFNNIVNSVLNKFKVSANVKSGPFTIRKGKQTFDKYDWYDQKPEWIRHNEFRGYGVQAIDEKHFLECRRIELNKKANEKRAQASQRLAQRPHLSLVGGA